MNVYVEDQIELTGPLTITNPEINLILLGDINTDHDLTLRVKNCVVFGSLTSSRILTIESQENTYNLGKIHGHQLHIATLPIMLGSDEGIIGKIQRLGIDAFVVHDQIVVKVPKQNLSVCRNNAATRSTSYRPG